MESSRRRRRRSRRRRRDRRRRARRAQRNFAECTNYRLGAAQAIPFKTAAAAAPPVALPGFGHLISKNKPASQVSEGWSGRPSRAVDGNSNGSYGSGSCTHTGVATRAWWKVDLRATYAVDKVVVWNRVDCCASRLNNFEVLVDSQLCGKVGHAHRSNTVSCHKKKGRSVTVRLAGRNYLTLCEVQVYGGTCSEEQEQLQLGSGVSATERCEKDLCGISGLCTIPSQTVKDMINQHVQDCSDDETAGFSDDMTLVKTTFCDAIEDSIESTDLCPAAKLCVAAGLIQGTGSGYKAFC